MFAWGNRHFAPEGPRVLLVDKKSQRVADPVLVDRRSRRPLRMPDGASIILNASIVASKGLSSKSVYRATKPAVRSFARTWTTDLKNRRIRVNAVSPGSIDTPGLSTYCLPQKLANTKETDFLYCSVRQRSALDEIAHPTNHGNRTVRGRRRRTSVGP